MLHGTRAITLVIHMQLTSVNKLANSLARDDGTIRTVVRRAKITNARPWEVGNYPPYQCLAADNDTSRWPPAPADRPDLLPDSSGHEASPLSPYQSL